MTLSAGSDCEEVNSNKTFDIPKVFLQSLEPCVPSCSVCAKLTVNNLDASPVVLNNELTGEYKIVPQYAASNYLSRWSPFSEMPRSKAKHLLG